MGLMQIVQVYVMAYLKMMNVVFVVVMAVVV